LGYSANGGRIPVSGGFEEVGEAKEVKEMEEVWEEICDRGAEGQRHTGAERFASREAGNYGGPRV
jgi:hypothetical protein